MPLAVTEGGFSTPNSEVWGNVTALVEVKSGHCKSLRCDSCEKTRKHSVVALLAYSIEARMPHHLVVFQGLLQACGVE
jgi:hypothetical protein